MKKISLPIISAALLLALGASAAQAEAIGRVLVAVGDTTALRNGAVVKLARGAEVHSGDTLRVGDASNMQVRFSDEGITALRSNSEFRIDDYKFERDTNVGKSFFSLVKGGMRSITGLIGRFNRDNYAVKAQTATIGIRGTHFMLAQCNNDCFNKDGSQADNGLFGGVTDGRIAVSNQAGEQEFGKNQFFHVASSDMLPKPLLVPPSFLRDQLEGQAKSEKGEATATQEPGAEGSETAGSSTEQQTNTAVTTQPTDGAPPAVQASAAFVPAEQPVVQSDVSGGLIVAPTVGQTYPYQYAWVSAWTGTYTKPNATGGFGYSDAGIDAGILTVLDPVLMQQQISQDKTLFADIVINQGTPVTFFANAYTRSGTWSYIDYSNSGPCYNNCIGVVNGTASYTWSKTASTNMGSSVAAGNLSWGRYTMTVSGTILTGSFAGNAYSETNYEHWATGDVVTAMPTSGNYTYIHAGGTQPTDQNGNTGTFAAGSTVGIQFNQSGAAVTAYGVWTMDGAGASGNSYTLNINTPVQVGIAQQSYSYAIPGGTDVGTTTYIQPIVTTASCAGTSCPASVTATVSPMLFGANAQGLAAGISTMPTLVNGQPVSGEYTSSVQVYQRPM